MTEEQKQISLKHEVKRLKADYAARTTDDRPVPHSVAVAYRRVIDAKEALTQSER